MNDLERAIELAVTAYAGQTISIHTVTRLFLEIGNESSLTN